MRDTIAGRFELLTPIAEGGSGAVWRAHDLRLGTECAAKLLRQRDSADLLRFVREQSVNLDHPHVVAPYGWAAEDEHVAIAMELVSGGTLEAALQDNGAVADWLAEEFVCQLLEALRFVHTRGWVHRDVKPANVLLEPTGSRLPVARLADFGIAVRLDDARLTHTGTVVGTPGYLPSEAYAPGNPSRSMDLYAAGVTAVRMVLPEVDLSADPLRPEDVAELELFEDSPALRTGVAGLLDPDPEQRVRAADRLLAQLLDTASARAGRTAQTAEGEPFEVFDVLEPTTERELSPVADAARLPPGARRTADAPIAWHAVHRQAISAPERPAMTERGGDLLRPFSPVGDGGHDTERATTVSTTRWPVAGPPAEDSTELIDTAGTPVLEQVSETGGRATAAPGPAALGPQETARLTATSGDPAPAGAAGGMTTADPVGTRAAVPSGSREPGTRSRAPRWPWWMLTVTLAVLALVAGYVWLGPALARWGGAEGPGTAPEPTRAPETSGVPSDGTVSCVVTP